MTLRRAVAAFDFDGTLVPGDSLLPFVKQAAGPYRFTKAILRHGPRVALATLGRIGSRDEAKAAFVQTAFQGLDATAVAACGEVFAATLVDRLHPPAARRLRWHQAQGHEIVLISASLSVYLEPLGRLLGLTAVLATALEEGPDGRLTGSLVGANVRGPEKVRRLQQWLRASASEVWAYGDSAGDRELLAAADHPLLVRRGQWPFSDAD